MSAYPKYLEARAEAIHNANLAAAMMTTQAEHLRDALDLVDTSLRVAAQTQAIDQATYDKFMARLQRIRERRNGMECFSLEVQIKEAMDKAYKALP